MRERSYTGGREDRVAADMDVALVQSCKLLTLSQDTHDNRKFIAQKIIDLVNAGITDISQLKEAGKQAVGLLNAIKPSGQGGGTLA